MPPEYSRPAAAQATGAKSRSQTGCGLLAPRSWNVLLSDHVYRSNETEHMHVNLRVASLEPVFDCAPHERSPDRRYDRSGTGLRSDLPRLRRRLRWDAVPPAQASAVKDGFSRRGRDEQPRHASTTVKLNPVVPVHEVDQPQPKVLEPPQCVAVLTQLPLQEIKASASPRLAAPPGPGVELT